ncbi:MAG: ATP-binding cassette domain-containing protein, partial [Firmicutes bacterium]|nr:ATP-binding cassette domain-containing protein [Bacillota bacterium]
MEPIIKIEGLNKQFSSSKGLFSRKKTTVNAVQDFTLDIYEGEILGLIGESGSGKTTLARVLLGLTRSTGGSVEIGGLQIAGAGKSKIKKARE